MATNLQKIHLDDSWLIDSVTKKIVGVKSHTRAADAKFGTNEYPVGMFGSASTVNGTQQLTVQANQQAVVFKQLTVTGNASLTVSGELRVVTWPT